MGIIRKPTPNGEEIIFTGCLGVIVGGIILCIVALILIAAGFLLPVMFALAVIAFVVGLVIYGAKEAGQWFKNRFK